jgi:hypothetical protein
MEFKGLLLFKTMPHSAFVTTEQEENVSMQ